MPGLLGTQQLRQLRICPKERSNGPDAMQLERTSSFDHRNLVNIRSVHSLTDRPAYESGYSSVASGGDY